MLALIPLFLTKDQQGLYFTFFSLTSLQIFFDLGLNYVVIQIVAHETAASGPLTSEAVKNDPARFNRIASLVQLLVRWYCVAAAAFFVGLGSVGAWFFLENSEFAPSSWLPQWLLLVTAVSLSLLFSPLLSVFEGAGNVGEVARLRRRQAMAGSFLAWAALVAGGGLWAITIPPLVQVAGTAWWLGTRGKAVPALASLAVTPPGVSWRREIFPFQWRVALSWMSGYFILQAFTPLVFAHSGAVEAGRIGLSLTIFSSIQMLGIGWISARTPLMASLIATGDRPELNRVFRRVAIRAVAFVALSAVGFVIAATVARHIEIKGVDRISDTATLICMAAATICYTIVFALAAYMRAHKKEPLLVASVATGALTLVGVYLAAPHGSFYVMAVYSAIALLLSLPWAALVFHRNAKG